MSWLEELRRMNESVSEQQEATTKDGKRFRAYLTSGTVSYTHLTLPTTPYV